MLLRIARSRNGGKITHYDLYKVQDRPGMTILDALFQIQDKMDPSLAFRYSCRGAVCGTCAILIDKEPRLACKTQLAKVKELNQRLQEFPALTSSPKGWNPKEEILIEPLPNFPILKDLVVDLKRFYDALEKMKLWASPAKGNEPRTQNPAERKEIERYLQCILCAICVASCPINAEKEEYLGPAALAKAWRFAEDSRTSNRGHYLDAAASNNGAALCELIMNCVKACPKGVAPGGAIRKIKKELGQID
ncbi:succinate dehydrogenase/fumarate reductase iron-sulfur subunit [Candidatus Thorarchaeota archaeon]|nr:MAG: succinate dehydrogenase/fumarate reductase iron-sulfur subunit [Candidatus Thorarchaeota archaeon]